MDGSYPLTRYANPRKTLKGILPLAGDQGRSSAVQSLRANANLPNLRGPYSENGPYIVIYLARLVCSVLNKEWV